MMERRKYNSLDICKLLMAICVVAIHTHPLENCTTIMVNNLYDSFVRMAVPFFFLSSGFLMAQKFEISYASQKNIATVRKYLLKITKMYVVWTVVYLPMAIYHFASSGTSVLRAVLVYIKGFVFIGEQYNSWHLWYLLSTIYALIFILVLFYLKISPKKMIIFSSIIFLISIGIDYLSVHADSSNIFLEIFNKMIKVSIRSGRILTGLFYLPLGCFLAQKQPNLKVSWLMLISGYLLNVFVQNSYWSSFFVAISSIGLFCVINTIALPDSRVYPFVRKMSTITYFVHMYVWSFYYVLIYGEKIYGADCFLVTIIICLVVSAATILVTESYNKKKMKAIKY
jgi:surface polysaccharide O-acyltransferase-like enzyme